MSGIAGIVRLDGTPVGEGTMYDMGAALAHRGSDGCGVWVGDDAGLVHRSFETASPAARERWPFVGASETLVLVADARIDNRDELARSLDLRRDASQSDAALILASYERWGADCPKALVGDFAFAIWDRRIRRLFCARDAMGVKPFYYVASPRFFAFASEAKALFRLREVPRDPDPQQVATFLDWRHDERVRTLYRSVDRLAAAHAMLVGPGTVVQRRYWELDTQRELHLASDEEYAAAFRELFTEAVRCRIRSVHPVGTTLSGGLDSSAIACTARRLVPAGAPSLHAFSVVFPELPTEELRLIDERAYVDAVLAGGDLESHFVRGDHLSPLADVSRLLWHLDEPYFAPNLYLHWAMFGAARASGVRVFLDGLDGDATVGHGFGRLASLARARRWDVLESEVRAFARNRGLDAERVLDAHVLPGLADLARRGRFVAWSRGASELSRRFGLSRRRVAAQYGARPFAARLRHPRSRDGRVRTERQAQIETLSRPIYQLALEMMDKCASAFGVEPRYPFLDRRLMEFCVALPEEQKFADGWPRILLRRAMAGILPERVRWRSDKANLSPNFHRQLRAADRALVDMSLGEPLAAYLDTARLRVVADRYFRGTNHDNDAADGPLLFRATTLSAWLVAQGGDGVEVLPPFAAEAAGTSSRWVLSHPKMSVPAGAG